MHIDLSTRRTCSDFITPTIKVRLLLSAHIVSYPYNPTQVSLIVLRFKKTFFFMIKLAEFEVAGRTDRNEGCDLQWKPCATNLALHQSEKFPKHLVYRGRQCIECGKITSNCFAKISKGCKRVIVQKG